jgi:predicted aspartyl protease
MLGTAFIFDYYKYPIVPVKFSYKNRDTPIIDALLDSGGDFIVIPIPIAKYLGLKLKKAGSVDTAGGTTQLFKSNLDMTIGKKDYIIAYNNLEIHVSGRDDIPVLLGRNPIFEEYEITFKKKENQLILKSNVP